MDLNQLKRQSNAYKKVFGVNTPSARTVLNDLRQFCRADQPTADVDNVYATYLAEGRREVWCRIMAHLNLSEQEIHDLQSDLREEQYDD